MSCKFYLAYSEIDELSHGIAVDFDGTVWQFPFDENNRHYSEYLAWIAEGNTPEPWNPEGEE